MSENMVAKQDNVEVTAVQEQKHNMSERFINMVLSQFINTVGRIEVSDYQKQLVQGYFIKIDRALALAEKSRNKNNNLSYIWENVNLRDLALDVVYYTKVGLDMMEDNHLFPIPYKNSKTNKYDVVLMCGYNGIQYIAEKYAVNKPKCITIELIYSTDTFKVIKKDFNNKVEAYQFEINNPFDRGELIGGFGYIEYDDISKNKLVFMNKAAIEKRKPKNASAEFWGGKTKEWQNGKLEEVEKEGWIDEMYLKTLKREVYSSKYILRDPEKIDDSYQYIRRREFENVELETEQKIEENANRDVIDIDEVNDSAVDETEKVAYKSNNNVIKEKQPEMQEEQFEQEEVFDGPDF